RSSRHGCTAVSATKKPPGPESQRRLRGLPTPERGLRPREPLAAARAVRLERKSRRAATRAVGGDGIAHFNPSALRQGALELERPASNRRHPLAPAGQRRPANQPLGHDAMASPGGKTILVVDDEDVIRVALEYVLGEAGYVVAAAANGR